MRRLWNPVPAMSGLRRGVCAALVVLAVVAAALAFVVAALVQGRASSGADEANHGDVRATAGSGGRLSGSADQQAHVYEQGEVCPISSVQNEGIAPWTGEMDVTLDSCRLYDSLEDAQCSEDLGTVFYASDDVRLQGKKVLTITLTLSNKNAVSAVKDDAANVIVGSFFTPYYLVETNEGPTEVPLRELSFSGVPYDDDPMHEVDFALPVGASVTVTFGFLVDDALDPSSIVLAPSCNGAHPYQFDLGL